MESADPTDRTYIAENHSRLVQLGYNMTDPSYSRPWVYSNYADNFPH